MGDLTMNVRLPSSPRQSCGTLDARVRWRRKPTRRSNIADAAVQVIANGCREVEVHGAGLMVADGKIATVAHVVAGASECRCPRRQRQRSGNRRLLRPGARRRRVEGRSDAGITDLDRFGSSGRRRQGHRLPRRQVPIELAARRRAAGQHPHRPTSTARASTFVRAMSCPSTSRPVTPAQSSSSTIVR